MKKIQEEIANSAGGGGVAGLTEPIVRKRGKFAGHDTFIVSRNAFASLKDAKKKGKHWRTYLEEDDAFKEIREYAKKHKGPIVVEDEATGACMFVRYGADGALFEAVENSVTTGDRGWLSDTGKSAKDVRADAKNNYGKDHYLGKFKGHYVRKTKFDDATAYHLQDPKTGKITHSVNGSEKRGVLKIGGASSTGKSDIKMHDFYHHLLKNHLKALVGTDHSEGAKKVWQKLSSKRGISVHGWHKGKAVNLDPKDESETHAPRRGDSMFQDTRSKEEKEVADTHLVASYHKKGAKRI